MKKNNTPDMEETQDREVDFKQVADEKKREFIKKYGKLVASAPAMGFLLMTAGTSKAHAASDGGAP